MKTIKQILHENLLLEFKNQETSQIDKFGDEVKIITNWVGFKVLDKQYKTLVKDYFVDILMKENNISEKNFVGVDEMINKTREFFNVNKNILDDIIKDAEKTNERIGYIAEKIYTEYYKNHQ